MLDLYLPIAGIPLNLPLMVAMGAAVGFLSGLFGIGGGFLLTPLLIFMGVPSSVAVGTVATHMLAASASGAITYFQRRLLDLKLGLVLLASGSLGAVIGVAIFSTLRAHGQLDLVLALIYVVLLGGIGGSMSWEAGRVLWIGASQPLREHARSTTTHRMWWPVHYPVSGVTLPLLSVLSLGLSTGVLSSLLGIGGGFVLVPALIYTLRIPQNIVIGTSLFQTFGTMLIAVMLHAGTNHNIDLVLGLALMVGGVVGAQLGTRASERMRADHLRLALGLLILAVGIRFAVELITPPRELLSLTVVGR